MLAASVLMILAGAGCLGGSSTSTTADGGMWMSGDGGTTWTAISVLPTASGTGSIASTDVTAIEIDPQDATAYYIGTKANGMFVSLDKGTTWQRLENEEARSGAIVDIEVDPRDVCTYYVLKPSRLLKTTSCGREFDTEAYVESRTETLTDLELDWYAPDTVYVTTSSGDVIRSRDAAANWTTVTNVKDDIYTFEVSNADSRILIAGTRSHGLYRSTDSGVTWTEMEDEMKKTFRDSDKVSGLAQTADGKTLYMSSGYGLLVSKDMGATWSDVPLITSRGEVDILALGVNPVDGNEVFYGTDSVFFRSTSGGSAWTSEELPGTRAASALLMNADESVILLGVEAIED